MTGARALRFAPGVRLRREENGAAFLLVPEGIVDLSSSAADVFDLIDGIHTQIDIVARLAELYDAPLDRLTADVGELCASFRVRGFLLP